MITYDAEQTRQLLDYRAIAREIEVILKMKQQGRALAPERIVMGWNPSDCLLVMPAYDDEYLVNKLVTLHHENPNRGLPMIQGEVLLMRRSDGARLMKLDGSAVTAMRTAALSLVAIQKMGYAHYRTVTVCGSGVQAQAHVEAIFEWNPLCQIHLFARNLETARAITSTLQKRGCHIELTTNLANAIALSQVVISATSSQAPFIQGEWLAGDLQSKILFVAVGAYRADMAELSPEIVSRVEGPVVVDTIDGAIKEAGDLIGANIAPARLVGLETIDSVNLLGQVHLFKSVGNALWDLAAARAAFARQA